MTERETLPLGIRDVFWLTVAAVVGVGTVAGIALALWALMAAPGWASAGQALVAVFWALTFWRWITLGAWRRTRWGTPPGGVRHAQDRDLAA